ncbi:TetR/AcrR family transcriptional regulator [Nocardia puris]|uniref:TetR family transcriptional regulator n=1 Tax=Nocardia puris TaxID=208602 RepID=A0A366E386_9NOCA|nr:TetR/AcrR family transcriptional regulator [Nocardia puris]RBO96575.1 TetR family transcriptional regulator [Nocardia puris]
MRAEGWREERRQLILTVASELFAARGYHGTGMHDIARLTQCSKPVLYKSFSCKLELYLAVLDHHVATLSTAIGAALATESGNLFRIQAAVGALFDFIDSQSQGFRLIFEADVLDEPSVQWRVDTAVDTCITLIADAISRDSRLDPVRSRTLAAGLVGASRYTARHWLEAGRPIPKHVAADTIVALYWGGLSQLPLTPHHCDLPARIA